MMDLLLLHIPAAIALGFFLDFLLGDPAWFPHPIRGMGFLIAQGEKAIRRMLPKRERLGGTLLVLLLLIATAILSWGILAAAYLLSPWLGFAVQAVLCWQALAARSLKRESMKVYNQVVRGDISGARKAVSMIVGRDTQNLTMEQVVKATVETVSENLSDGVIAPLLFMALGGGPLGLCYKAVNTLDSMIGYKNERYLIFGRTAAKLDDVVNWIPARISAWLMIGAAFFLKLDWKKARIVYLRDRYNHASPNSAQTEAACAGALGIRLAGNAFYFGTLYEKPTIGDEDREICGEDIAQANRLMYGTAWMGLIMAVLISGAVFFGCCICLAA